MPDLAQITHQDFDPLVGQTFVLTLPDHPEAGSVNLTLTRCRPEERFKSPRFERVPFSLILQSESEPQALPQGTFRLTHAQFGAMDVFMVPISEAGDGYLYQVAFS